MSVIKIGHQVKNKLEVTHVLIPWRTARLSGGLAVKPKRSYERIASPASVVSHTGLAPVCPQSCRLPLARPKRELGAWN